MDQTPKQNCNHIDGKLYLRIPITALFPDFFLHIPNSSIVLWHLQDDAASGEPLLFWWNMICQEKAEERCDKCVYVVPTYEIKEEAKAAPANKTQLRYRMFPQNRVFF